MVNSKHQLNWNQHRKKVFVQVQEIWMIAKLHQQLQAQMKMKNPSKKLLKKVVWKKKWRRITFNIIRNIVRKIFKIHETNIKELINSNVNKTTERLDKLSEEIVDLTASLEFTQKKIDEELFQVKE